MQREILCILHLFTSFHGVSLYDIKTLGGCDKESMLPSRRKFKNANEDCSPYGTPAGTFLFQYLSEKKSRQKELERKSKQ